MELPDDICAKAFKVARESAADGWATDAALLAIGKALLAERLSATERALALLADPPIEALQAMWEAMFTEPWDGTQAPVVGAGFDAAVAAIRSQP